MKLYLRLPILTIFFLVTQNLLAQEEINSAAFITKDNCYNDSVKNITCFDPLVVKLDKVAYCKGTSENPSPSFARIKTEEILTKEHSDYYVDSAIAKFVIDQNGQMSNLTVAGTSNEQFKNVVLKYIKQSSCEWRPAEYKEQLVNSWVRIKFVFRLDKVTDLNKSVTTISWTYVEK